MGVGKTVSVSTRNTLVWFDIFILAVFTLKSFGPTQCQVTLLGNGFIIIILQREVVYFVMHAIKEGGGHSNKSERMG